MGSVLGTLIEFLMPVAIITTVIAIAAAVLAYLASA